MTQYQPDDLNRQRVQFGGLGLASFMGGPRGGQGDQIYEQGGPRFGFGGPRQPPPHWQILNQDPYGIKPMGEQITGFGETLGGYGEQIGGFESTLGGYGEKLGGFESSLGGFGQQMSGSGEQMGGFGEQMGTINEKLSSMQEGIASLTEQFGTMQQQNRPQQNFNPYASLFGGGMFSPYGGLGGLFGRYR